MIIDPITEHPTRIYSIMIRAITPRPIAWVSTLSPRGVPNLAPFSFFNGVCSSPAALMISPVNKADGTKKDTVRNIESGGQFVVNVVPFRVAEQMFRTSAELDYEESEFDAAGLTQRPSTKINIPGVAESPIHFECELMQIVHVGSGPLAANLIIGKILAIEIDDSVLDVDGKIDPQRVDAIGRMGSQDYCRTTERFSLK